MKRAVSKKSVKKQSRKKSGVKKRTVAKKRPAGKKRAVKPAAKPVNRSVAKRGVAKHKPQDLAPMLAQLSGALPRVDRRVRVLVAKPGLDGHDRGAKVIARALRDAGFEVVYTGLHQTPKMIISAAIQEDVQVIGISVLSGAHNAVVPEIIEGVKKAGLNDVLFLVGGIIPDEDIPSLKKMGVHRVFTPGASLVEIIEYLRDHAPARD